jgi:signal transduction histidine kinase
MEDLRAVDRMKSRFIASMSHELRTPLNAILNFAQFVSTGMLGEVNEQQKEALQRIVSSGTHLLSLINDILDIAKIEAGMMQLFVEDNVKLDEELAMVVATSEGLFREGTVRFVTRIEPGLPTIVGDRRRIRQILLNLIANAAKFTEQGEVEFRARRDGDYVLFSVRDTGKGIPVDKREDIFVPFHQTRDGLRHDTGTGLGLPISRSLAEAHEGMLWVESEEGRGAMFFVKLPIRSEALLTQL